MPVACFENPGVIVAAGDGANPSGYAKQKNHTLVWFFCFMYQEDEKSASAASEEQVQRRSRKLPPQAAIP